MTDPALHVGTWQRDAGLDLHSPAARAQAGAWLDWLAAQKVEAVGFGFLTLRRTDRGRTEATPTVVVEDLPDDLTDPLGPEVAGWLDRVDWLRAHATDDALLDARLRLTDGVVLEPGYCRRATAGDDGWVEEGTVVARAEGPRWRHEVDEPAAALLAGCRGALPLRDIVELLAFAHDRPVDALVAAALPRCARWCGTGCWCRSVRANGLSAAGPGVAAWWPCCNRIGAGPPCCTSPSAGMRA